VSLPSAPYKPDQDARALRERFELAAVRDDTKSLADAARELYWFCAEHSEYRLLALVPTASPEAESAKLIPAKFEGRCKTCSRHIVPGEMVLWTAGERGVACKRCGDKP
jgi:DNA-directed RNA polymerase subunit RPC12/RpoP